jgi:hypothetical protein
MTDRGKAGTKTKWVGKPRIQTDEHRRLGRHYMSHPLAHHEPARNDPGAEPRHRTRDEDEAKIPTHQISNVCSQSERTSQRPRPRRSPASVRRRGWVP